MANAKLITDAQIKKRLRDFERDELVKLITDIATACPQAREYLTASFAAPEDFNAVIEKYKAIIENEFYPKRGFGNLDLRTARKAVTDFKRICPDKIAVVDMMLFYVENCVRFTADFGDIYESFYNSAESMFNNVVKEINQSDAHVYALFAERLKAAAENACEGWGFQDNMMDIYYQIAWLDPDEE